MSIIQSSVVVPSSRAHPSAIKPKTPLTANQLSVFTWRQIFEYLPEFDKTACSFVSRRLRIVVKYDPSKGLESMGARKAGKVHRPCQMSFKYGPTQKFLFSNPSASKELYKIQLVLNKMSTDRNVAKTVLAVCELEALNSEYIPLYHSMNLTTFTFSFFTKILLSTPYLPFEKFPSSVPLIRFPSPDGPKTIEDLFKKLPMSKDQPYDKIPAVQKELLSLNPHLFANFMVDGESTWYFYLQNQSVNPPSIETFFKMLCSQYQLPMNVKALEKLKDLQEELYMLGERYARLNVLPENRDDEASKGMLLQILAPPSILDKVGYPSLPYGTLDTSSKLPLSKRCLRLREDPRAEGDMQVRVLSQSLFVPDHSIKVIPHGCGDFFSESDPVSLPGLNTSEQLKQKNCLIRKKAIIKEAREIFSDMMLSGAKK